MEKIYFGNSILDYLNWATSYLEEYDISNARRNAEELLCYVSGKSRLEFYLENGYCFDDYSMSRYVSLLKKRSRGYPLQYILGNVEFFGLNLEVCEGVFIPRPETEILVEKIIDMVKLLNPVRSNTSNGVNCQTVKLLDIGTGSGSIAVSLAKFLPEAKIYATDISYDALCLTQKNAEINGVRNRISFFSDDIFDALKDERHFFDLIVSNPPYIPAFQLENLQPEIKHEPRIALDGGKDGLFYIGKIIQDAPRYLKRAGTLVMEIGFGQTEAVRKIFSHSEFDKIEFVKDYQGIDRVVVLY